MGRCWTCGAEVGGHVFTCSVCQKTQRELVARRQRISTSTPFSKFIDYSLTELFFGKEDTRVYIAADIASTLENISSLIEWGFEELNWKMEQMTYILESIDATLKTPGQTQANEWRQIAEELRRRGVLEESEQYFSKSLEQNPLDYRTYVGLAETHIQMGKFDEAKTLLQRSLIHAPENKHKSYSYRLIGHIYFSEEDYKGATLALQSSVELSPSYYLGHYDYAQYCALLGDKENCLNSLRVAISGEPSLFRLAERERNFEVLKQEVKNFLEGIRPDLRIADRMRDSSGTLRFIVAESDLEEAEKTLSMLIKKFGAERTRELKKCRKECDRARSKFKKAREISYQPFSQVRRHVFDAIRQAEKAKNRVLDLQNSSEA